jgi:hypothetical protein
VLRVFRLLRVLQDFRAGRAVLGFQGVRVGFFRLLVRVVLAVLEVLRDQAGLGFQVAQVGLPGTSGKASERAGKVLVVFRAGRGFREAPGFRGFRAGLRGRAGQGGRADR